MASLVQMKTALAARQKQLTELKNGSHMGALVQGAGNVATCGAAGVLDGYAGEVAGVPASLGVSLVAVGAGVAMRSPKLIQGATAVIGAHAYVAAKEWSVDMYADPSEPKP